MGLCQVQRNKIMKQTHTVSSRGLKMNIGRGFFNKGFVYFLLLDYNFVEPKFWSKKIYLSYGPETLQKRSTGIYSADKDVLQLHFF